MFPRTALVLRELLPNCAITIIEEKPEHIALAQHWIDPGIECITARYDAFFSRSFDAVVIPLAFRGDVEGLCAGRKSATLFVHDWLWRRRGKSRVVSWLLCKRLNRIDP